MENVTQRLAEELRSQANQYFTVDYLRKAALSSVEVKVHESLLFARMAVLHYRMFEGDGEEIYRAAAGVEFMILGLDIIDDLQDEDHKEMPWLELPRSIALNLALAFLTLSQEMILGCRFPLEHAHKAAAFLNRQVLTAINGQTLDLLNDIGSEEAYLSMVRQKSAALLVSACMTGVILATGEVSGKVEEYALEMGIAAQIKNDFRDLLNWERKNDFLHRKRTLPVLFLLSVIEEEEDRWVIDYFEGRLELADILHRSGEFAALVERSGTSMYSSFRMRSYYYHFLELLEDMNLDPSWKQELISVAE